MKVTKEVLDPQRLRQIPKEGFSWIDRRFVREGFIDRLPRETILFYFFLLAVSDREGLNFYSDPTIGKILKLNPEELTQARARLIGAELILYRHPVYQVLPLPRKAEPSSGSPRVLPSEVSTSGGEPMSLGEILRLATANVRGPQEERPMGKEI